MNEPALSPPGDAPRCSTALRRGTVPRFGLDVLAVGLGWLEPTIAEEPERVRRGGKTFFGRWLQERARCDGFASSEVQISGTETPLRRLETVYRRLIENLATADSPRGALRSVIEGWFYALEREAEAEGETAPGAPDRIECLLEQRLADPAALRAVAAERIVGAGHGLTTGKVK